ncbi:MAG: hypothetical protein ABII79_14170, partial [bacterium]
MTRKFTFAGTKRKKTFLLLLGVVIWIAAGSTPAFAAEIFTDTTEYPPGDTANIDGLTFWSEEIVTLQITNMDGTPLEIDAGLPWDVLSNSIGDFETAWILPFEDIAETLLVTAIGTESGLTAETTILAPKTYLNQLQNGTATTPPQWANGNINGSNACYSEGRSVSYRYFIKQLDGGTGHYFTIQMEWTKGGIHALDYLTDYDATEDSAINLTGGPCGTISTTPPPGCSAPTDSFLLPDPTDSNNYTGTIPPDFFTKVNPSFVLDGPRYLKAYNVGIDSVGKYYFTGTSSDREFNMEVYFTVDTTGSAGFFWGGHLASGTDDAWGFGNGSASVSGAPYHMRTKYFDGGGAAGQDRSIQNGVICLPPEIGMVCDADTVCDDTGYTYVCRDTSDAHTWTWTVVNGSIVGSDALDSVVFNAAPGLSEGDTILVIVQTCDTLGGCPGEFCCATDTAVHIVKGCNDPPTASCAGDTSLFVCDLSEICLPGFGCSDPNGNLVSCDVSLGTLNGDTLCFTPTGSGNYIVTVIATDAFGLADTCTTTLTVTCNGPPVADAGPDQSLFLAEPTEICWPASCSDVDGNLAECALVEGPGTYDDTSICFITDTPGVYVFVLEATDDCAPGRATGYTHRDTAAITITYNVPPVVTCSGDTSIFLCELSEICIPGFSCSDVDDNLVSCDVSLGTLSGDTVCFTPTGAGVYTITLIATDSLGAADTCTANVTVTVNSPPVATCPGDDSMFVCDLSDICIGGFAPSDVDDNITSVTATGGTLSGDTVCFTPSIGANTITLIVTDACGEADTCLTTITLEINTPDLTCAGDDLTCDSTLASATVTVNNPGDLGTLSYNWTPDPVSGDGTAHARYDAPGTYKVVVTDLDTGCKDSCEATITQVTNSPPWVTCPVDEIIEVC